MFIIHYRYRWIAFRSCFVPDLTCCKVTPIDGEEGRILDVASQESNVNWFILIQHGTPWTHSSNYCSLPILLPFPACRASPKLFLNLCPCICSPSTVLEPPSLASLLCRVVACRFPPTYSLLVSKEGRLDGSFMCALELGCKETLPSLRTGLSRDTTFSTHFLQIPAAAVLMFLVLCYIL